MTTETSDAVTRPWLAVHVPSRTPLLNPRVVQDAFDVGVHISTVCGWVCEHVFVILEGKFCQRVTELLNSRSHNMFNSEYIDLLRSIYIVERHEEIMCDRPTYNHVGDTGDFVFANF